ncbi:MAG: hypothetical protein SchgKO_00020 [Schleiferiaceae bacterium]
MKLTLFLLLSSLLSFAQPFAVEDGDSLFVVAVSKSKSVGVSLWDRQILVQGEVVDEALSALFWQGVDSVAYEDTRSQKSHLVKNDTLYNYFREKVLLYQSEDNWDRKEPSHKYYENGIISMKIEVWRTQMEEMRFQVFERSFFYVIGNQRYYWKQDFKRFYDGVLALRVYIERE